MEGTVKATGLASVAGRRLLMPATIFQSAYTKGFVPAKRVNMIYFHFPFEEIDDVKMRAPTGYKIETTPGYETGWRRAGVLSDFRQPSRQTKWK